MTGYSPESPMTRTLLVIDIQNDYFAGGLLPLWQAEETEARILDGIGQARARGDRIVLVRHVSNAAAGLFAPGSEGSAIRPAILEAAGVAPVVVKHHADAFQETGLTAYLEGSDTLLVCGMMTQNCVVFTALSPEAAGLRVRVIGDLCTAPSEVVHRVAVSALRSKGLIASLDEVWG